MSPVLKPGDITAFDGGYQLVTLDRLKNKNCVGESCYNLPPGWIETTAEKSRSIIARVEKYKLSDEKAAQLSRRAFHESLNILKESYAPSQTWSPALEECFTNTKYNFLPKDLTHFEIQKRIDLGQPVLVAADQHAFVVTGYQTFQVFMGKGKPRKTGAIYQTIDSNYNHPEWDLSPIRMEGEKDLSKERINAILYKITPVKKASKK
jgi:hypothetical protein